jgi:tetratricopeptide (TPR) repeat protein
VKRRILLPVVLTSMMTLAGCSTQNTLNNNTAVSNATASNTTSQPSASKKKDQTVIIGAKNYQGADNLHKFETAADANPKDVKAQIDAGISAYVNGDYQAAIKYYKAGIAADPKNVIPYNNLGNVYLRSLKQPQQALPYYKKATQVNPKYAFGWINLAQCEAQLGDKAAAKAAIQSGLKSVPTTDKNYKIMQADLQLLNK